jgi:hypothetical protein
MFFRSRQLRSYSRISQHFTKPESLLPCSQEPSAGSNPEPAQSSSYHPNSGCPESTLLLPQTCVKVVLVVIFLLAFPSKSYIH